MKRNVSKKQVAFILVAVCLVGLIGIGISYSYYLANISTSNEANKNSDISSATITKVVMDMQGKVTSDGAYPGHKVVKEVVVRGIGSENAIPANAAILITPDLGDFANDVTWKLYKSDTAITCSSTVHEDGEQYYEEATCNIPDNATLELEGGASSSYKNIVVKPNTETKYYLVVEYANKENEDQSDQMGKSFNIDIGIGEKQLEGLDKIVASVDDTGKCPTINSDGTVNVTKKEDSYGYICSAEDAYGTSYYYRGNVTNNYVKFAGFYWRIIRINGDGTVRVIYDGTSAHVNGEKSSDRHIGTSEFNEYWKKDNVQEATNSGVYNDNAGVGYMYGNRDAVAEPTTDYSSVNFSSVTTYYIAKEYNYDATTDRFTLKDPIAILGKDLTKDYIGYYCTDQYPTSTPSSVRLLYKITDIMAGTPTTVRYGFVRYGTSSKEVAQTNTNDSDIKAYLDTWYKNNILDTENEQYLVDNTFCNDRSFSENNTGTGAGTSTTRYRWLYFSDAASKSTLKCPQQNDAFTVGDTTYGNGALTYPIGLISTDEVVLAGGYNSNNSHYYLYSGQTYWTSSPREFDGNIVRRMRVDFWGSANCSTSSDDVVRPVLNLSQEVLQNGDGSMENPYQP